MNNELNIMKDNGITIQEAMNNAFKLPVKLFNLDRHLGKSFKISDVNYILDGSSEKELEGIIYDVLQSFGKVCPPSCDVVKVAITPMLGKVKNENGDVYDFTLFVSEAYDTDNVKSGDLIGLFLQDEETGYMLFIDFTFKDLNGKEHYFGAEGEKVLTYQE